MKFTHGAAAAAIAAAASAILLIVACNLDDNGGKGQVFSCDARVVADYCIEEPASLSTQEKSKSTCKSVPRAVWSDSTSCTSGYTKKCSEGDTVNYYYAKEDGSKTCDQLAGYGTLLTGAPSSLRQSFEPRR